MKNFLKTMVVVVAVIIVGKTCFTGIQDYICDTTERNIEYQANSGLSTMAQNLGECKVNCEFVDPFTLQVTSYYEDISGNQWNHDVTYVNVVDLL